mgnify:CR=1 FL=1
MTKERFFDVFGQIDPAYILAADAALRGRGRARRRRRRIVRTALLAAAIAGLLTATAYAAGWFGLTGRLIKDSDSAEAGAAAVEAEDVLNALRPVHHRDYISLGGVVGSPEYQAAAEWLAFRGSYADEKTAQQLENGGTYCEWRDLERSFAPDARTREICRLYQVWDQTMWERLQLIAEKHSLALHSSRTPLYGGWKQTREQGIYEDGSFVASLTAEVDGQSCLYTLYHERGGSIPCDDMTASAADEYAEWEYTAADGRSVSIAVRDTSTNDTWAQYDILLFCPVDGATVTVKASCGYSRADSAADERRFAERLADGIDFAAPAPSAAPVLCARALTVTPDMARRAAAAVFGDAELYEYSEERSRAELAEIIAELESGVTDEAIRASHGADAPQAWIDSVRDARLAFLEYYRNAYANAREEVAPTPCLWRFWPAEHYVFHDYSGTDTSYGDDIPFGVSADLRAVTVRGGVAYELWANNNERADFQNHSLSIFLETPKELYANVSEEERQTREREWLVSVGLFSAESADENALAEAADRASRLAADMGLGGWRFTAAAVDGSIGVRGWQIELTGRRVCEDYSVSWQDESSRQSVAAESLTLHTANDGTLIDLHYSSPVELAEVAE